MAEATCAWCGATFQRRRSDQRCCDQACGKKYANNVQRRKYPCTCRVCGTEWVATKPSQVCSSECLGVEHAHRIAGREPNPLRNGHPRRRAAEQKIKKAAKGTKVKKRAMVAGYCRRCGAPFVHTRTTGGKPPEFCSVQCARQTHKEIRRAVKRRTRTAPIYRSKILERDGYRCQICGKATKRGAKVPDPMAPTLDHIVPLACGGTHTEDNLQCAHFECNWRKSDGVGGQGDQLRLAC